MNEIRYCPEQYGLDYVKTSYRDGEICSEKGNIEFKVEISPNTRLRIQEALGKQEKGRVGVTIIKPDKEYKNCGDALFFYYQWEGYAGKVPDDLCYLAEANPNHHIVVVDSLSAGMSDNLSAKRIIEMLLRGDFSVYAEYIADSIKDIVPNFDNIIQAGSSMGARTAIAMVNIIKKYVAKILPVLSC